MGSGRQIFAGVSEVVSDQNHSTTTIMPLMLELKYEYFPNTWPGRIKLLELILAFFCIVCCAPAYSDSQHWFLTVVVISFLGATFFYFTAFVSILSAFVDYEDEEYQYWIDAQIAAGVFGLLNFVVYAGGAYLIYMDWKANPTGGCSAPAPPTV